MSAIGDKIDAAKTRLLSSTISGKTYAGRLASGGTAKAWDDAWLLLDEAKALAGAPVPTPTPVPVPTSPDNTVVVGTTGSIIDASGHKWTITADAKVAVDGAPDAITSGVLRLAYEGGKVWQENSLHMWWYKTQPTDTWLPTGGTTTSPIPGEPAPAPIPTPTGRLAVVGVSTHIPQKGLAEAQRAKAAGAKLIRDEIPWSWSEGTKGSINWTNANKLLDAINAVGLPLIFQAGYAPGWANGGKNDKVGPLNPAEFAQWFVTVTNYAHSRIGGLLYGVELWNEPNIGFLTNPANGMVGDPVYYADLLSAVWARRAEIPPGVRIIGGASSGSGVTGVRNNALFYPWLETVLARAGCAFHAYSCHPYSFWTDGTAEQFLAVRKDTGWGEVFYGSRKSPTDFSGPSLLQVLASAGFTGEIIASEVGVPTHGTGGHVNECTSEAEQARWLTMAVGQWRTKVGAQAGPFCVYTGTDDNTADTADRERHFGAHHSDFSPKPIVAQMKLAA